MDCKLRKSENCISHRFFIMENCNKCNRKEEIQVIKHGIHLTDLAFTSANRYKSVQLTSVQSTFPIFTKYDKKVKQPIKDTAVTQKLGILAMRSERFLKKGCRSLLYFCSTVRISSLACSFSLSISFCTSSICSIASCCSLSVKIGFCDFYVTKSFFLSTYKHDKLK